MAKFIKGTAIKVEARVEGRIGKDIQKKVNNNGKSYGMFTMAVPTGGENNETVWFTVFSYNMHEIEFIFDKCGYCKGDTLIVEGKLSRINEFTDSEGRTNEALDLSITAEKIMRGQRKRSASDAAEDNAPQPQPQPQEPQQQEIKSFSEVRENLAAEVDDDFPL